ncbi:MAG: exo-alpha-sialidase [Bacteroidetes bacterium]|nr:exo-alpha-sialidase [Bacteroidota bacterium]
MPNRPHIEPYIATNPIDPNNLVVGSIMISETGTWTCAAFASFDGGENWTRTTSNCKETSENCGDPWLAFGKDNTVYLSVLTAQKDSSGKHVERIVVFRSEDGGKTWLKPSFVPLGEGGASFDHPSIVVNTTSGSYSGTIYVIANQSFKPPAEKTDYHHHPIILSQSEDGGRTFSTPNRILPNNLVQQAGNPVILSDGTVALSFFDFAP